MLAAHLIPSIGNAEPLNRERILRWWDEEKRLAESLELLHGYTLTWRTFSDHVPPAHEIEAMRRRVEGRPDHPDRELLAEYEQRSRGERSTIHSIEVESPFLWRIESGGGYTRNGLVITSYHGTSWSFAASSLIVIDRNRPYPANVGSLMNPSMLRDVAGFVHHAASIQSLRGVPDAKIDIQLSSDRKFRMLLTPESGRPGAFVGVWPPDVDRPRVDAVFFYGGGEPTEHNYERAFYYENPKLLNPGGPLIYTRIVSVDTTYRRSYIQELLEVQPLSSGKIDVERLVVPDAVTITGILADNSGDAKPIRILDYRMETESSLAAAGLTAAVPDSRTGEVRIVRPDPEATRQAKVRIRSAGQYLALVGLLVIGVLLLYRMHRASTR